MVSTMDSTHEKISAAKRWLSDDVLPLWIRQGIDPRNGSFVESLSQDGEPMSIPRRAMVQARQIYSLVEAVHLELLPVPRAREIVGRAIDFFLTHYSLPSGGFIHAVTPEGKPANTQTDLYAQAFALFGLASAYEILGDGKLRTRALQALDYLKRERAFSYGGYSELNAGHPTCEANPHMHLFEAAIAWMRVDTDPRWKDLADELFTLCCERFIDRESGALCEHFAPEWKPLRESHGFVWEPGHHYEWAWLMMQYSELSSETCENIARPLYHLAETQGVDGKSLMALDEIWSDGKVKKRSSRFWPQSERIKAAVTLSDGATADRAMTQLFRYFENVKPGLWTDTLLESGEFAQQPAKASSLYHIINAIAQYTTKRVP